MYQKLMRVVTVVMRKRREREREREREYAYFIQQKEYVVLVHDVIWTLLGLYEVITSVDGDEEIT